MSFQMQSWSSTRLEWDPQEKGSAGSVWQPRPTAAEAIGKCLAWTGFHCIPAMQVVDLASGLVVWRGLLEPFHYEGRWHFTDAEAGPPIACADEPMARRIANELLDRRIRPTASVETHQEALF